MSLPLVENLRTINSPASLMKYDISGIPLLIAGLCDPSEIDYYGVTFDHNLPSDVSDPEVLQINIIEIEDDNG